MIDMNGDTPQRPITRRELAAAGLPDLVGMRVFSIPWNRERTLRKIENPLSSDSAAYLRYWIQDFPQDFTGRIPCTPLVRQLRDLRDQFVARLAEVA